MTEQSSQSETACRVALPVWKDRLSPVFESCSRYLLVDCRHQEILGRSGRDCIGLDQFGRVLVLFEEQANLLICGAITHVTLNIIQAQGILIKPFITGKTESVLQAYLQGQLDSPRYWLPGCGRRRGRRFRGGW